MHKTVTGSIISANISSMGKKRYGYLGIVTTDNEHLKIKITAFTNFDTLDVGATVTFELESVGDESLLTAKKITSSI
ncbi:hypothetical protein E4H12_09745 [Candidatus Thorarchaeota archaeon]|nr:MAG: hypothetical protein E4H12_09745 [Candidatus Thorarchaeota archaeon]